MNAFDDLAVFSSFEREVLGERVRAGLAHARQNGKRPSRASMSQVGRKSPTKCAGNRSMNVIFLVGTYRGTVANNPCIFFICNAHESLGGNQRNKLFTINGLSLILRDPYRKEAEFTECACEAGFQYRQ
jgi:hypothetical protein